MNEFNFYLEPLRGILYQIGAFLPRLLIAALVVIVGWLLAKVVRFAVTRFLRAVNFNVLTERSGLDNFLRQGGLEKNTGDIIGVLAYWLVVLAALIIAFNGLGLTYITDLLGRVVWFVPNIFVALLVLAFGSYFARFVGDAVITYARNVKMADARFFGKLAQYAIMIFVVLIALDHIKVGGDIVRESFIVILAGVVFALALAFGLAGKDWAADRIAKWWPRDGMPKPVVRDSEFADLDPGAGVPTEVVVEPAGTSPRPRGRPLMPHRPSDPPPPL